MRRLFTEHTVREVRELDGVWNFEVLEPETEEQKSIRTMIVPGCIENHPALSCYRGRMRYSKMIAVEGNIRFWFGGISYFAKVYFDGVLAGIHYNAYTGFEVVIEQVKKGEHLLEIEVNNAFSEKSALHFPNDYYTYGGLIRPTQMELLKDCYISQMKIDTVKAEKGWKLITCVHIKNLTDENIKIKVKAELNEIHYHDSHWILLHPHEETIYKMEKTFDDVIPYTENHAALYYVKTRLETETGTEQDDLIERIGFRELKILGKELLLNGKALYLKGVNRHEDYGDLGCCIPMDIMYRDIALMKSAGVNFVRTSHYQNDERFLDLCDENGILVWEEGHARGLGEEQMRNPFFMEQSKTGIHEMINSHCNHPSIIMWGILNECASHTAYGRECYQELFALIKKLDSSRPVTFASCHLEDDRCLDLPDILAFNIYPLWYTKESPKECLQKLHQYIEANGQKEKPLLISEIGAGGEYGFHSMRREKWSEERQADILKAQLKDILSDEKCMGVCIWQFADCRVSEEWFASRPKCRNNKGLLNGYRHPKLSYYVVCDVFHG